MFIQANFLGWHRWFIWEMEQALRNECNYTGSIPYWDWTKTADEGFANSQMFDGSATSLSGNGAPVNYTDADVIVANNGTSAEVGKSSRPLHSKEGVTFRREKN